MTLGSLKTIRASNRFAPFQEATKPRPRTTGPLAPRCVRRYADHCGQREAQFEHITPCPLARVRSLPGR